MVDKELDVQINEATEEVIAVEAAEEAVEVAAEETVEVAVEETPVVAVEEAPVAAEEAPAAAEEALVAVEEAPIAVEEAPVAVEEVVTEETEVATESEESMDDYKDMLESSMMRFHSGDLVDGEVISVTDTEVLVNFGYISDGIVPVTETFADVEHPLTSQFNVGDKVKAEVIRKDDGDGNVLLSFKKAQKEVVWEKLVETMEAGTIVNALVTEAVKGGLVCKVLQARAFMPGSMISTSFISDLTEFNGKTITVKIMELDKDKDRVIISHKVIEQAERELKKETIFASIKKGDVFTGTVKKNMNFGSFVDIGGVDGLVHINELSWNKINHPSEVVKEGDVVNVTVTNIDFAKGKIGLSMKDQSEDPWEASAKTLVIGKSYDGKVKNVLDFGAFVEVIPGVEGLVHISEMSSARISHPSEVAKPGDEVVVKVLGVDLKQRKIKLTMKLEDSAEVEEFVGDLKQYQSDEKFSTNLEGLFKDILKDLKK